MAPVDSGFARAYFAQEILGGLTDVLGPTLADQAVVQVDGLMDSADWLINVRLAEQVYGVRVREEACDYGPEVFRRAGQDVGKQIVRGLRTQDAPRHIRFPEGNA